MLISKAGLTSSHPQLSFLMDEVLNKLSLSQSIKPLSLYVDIGAYKRDN